MFHITGPHRVTVDYCNCDNELVPGYQQLLREKWFPATLTRPQTVFTFDCLEMFHELTLQGKTNLYDYYHSLLRRFDNAGRFSPIVSDRDDLILIADHANPRAESIWRIPPRLQDVEEPDGIQARRAWP